MTEQDWTEANQRLLSAEFSRLKARLAGQDAREAKVTAANARATMPAAAAIDIVVNSFGLSVFEKDVILLCAGTEMDAELADLCAKRASGAGRPYPTFALALEALAEPHWSALSPIRSLRKWRLIELSDERGLTTGRLRIAERLLHFLAGINYLDPSLSAFIRPSSSVRVLARSHAATSTLLLEALQSAADIPVTQLVGDDPEGQEAIVSDVATRMELNLHVMRATDIPEDSASIAALAALWHRDSVLLRSVLLIQADESRFERTREFADRLHAPVFLCARKPLEWEEAQCFEVARPASTEQRAVWAKALGEKSVGLNGALDAVASQYRLSTSAIRRVADSVAPEASASEVCAMVSSGCRNLARARLADVAQRIEPVATWQDLVLPAPQIETLHLIAAQARQRVKVYEDWGFSRKGSRGLGISVLFSGESGTGKTMAAEVLANELDLDLFQIDLAAIVSKYIGETEKNLRRVFDTADDSGAILLFDEADALFGRRGEVNDSHDRYANIEVSYLLQRMEAYRGLAILTTNLKKSLDSAFQRRLRFVLEFPFPDARLRERIWRGAFPASTPLQAVDYGKLAQLNVAGGAIRNIAMNAAFLAANEEGDVGMAHLLRAARGDASKRERPPSDAETRGWM